TTIVWPQSFGSTRTGRNNRVSWYDSSTTKGESQMCGLGKYALMGALCLGLALTSPRVSAGPIFDFESVALNTTTTFAQSNSGVTATFSSPDGAVFSVGSSFFSTLTGHILFDNDPPLHALIIGFSSTTNFVSMNFAQNAGNGARLTIQAFLGGVGGTLVGSSTAGGSIPGGFTFPEGII